MGDKLGDRMGDRLGTDRLGDKLGTNWEQLPWPGAHGHRSPRFPRGREINKSPRDLQRPRPGLGSGSGSGGSSVCAACRGRANLQTCKPPLLPQPGTVGTPGDTARRGW